LREPRARGGYDGNTVVEGSGIGHSRHWRSKDPGPEYWCRRALVRFLFGCYVETWTIRSPSITSVVRKRRDHPLVPSVWKPIQWDKELSMVTHL